MCTSLCQRVCVPVVAVVAVVSVVLHVFVGIVIK